jgi:hypothetical protein
LLVVGCWLFAGLANRWAVRPTTNNQQLTTNNAFDL